MGQQLEKGGFTNLDALDSSPEMERTEARSAPSFSFQGMIGQKMAVLISQTPRGGGEGKRD